MGIRNVREPETRYRTWDDRGPRISATARSLAAVNRLLGAVTGFVILSDIAMTGFFGMVVLLGPFCALFWLASLALTRSATPSGWWVNLSCGVCALHMVIFGLGLTRLSSDSLLDAGITCLAFALFSFGTLMQLGGLPVSRYESTDEPELGWVVDFWVRPHPSVWWVLSLLILGLLFSAGH